MLQTRDCDDPAHTTGTASPASASPISTPTSKRHNSFSAPSAASTAKQADASMVWQFLSLTKEGLSAVIAHNSHNCSGAGLPRSCSNASRSWNTSSQSDDRNRQGSSTTHSPPRGLRPYRSPLLVRARTAARPGFVTALIIGVRDRLVCSCLSTYAAGRVSTLSLWGRSRPAR